MTAALACQKTSQHQTSTTLFRACGWDRATLPLPRSPSALSHIHSKTACRGALVAGGDRPAPVSADTSVGAGRSPLGSSTRAGRRDKSVPPFPPCYDGDHLPLPTFNWFSHPASSASNRCYPLQHPERTRFRPFGAFPGAFRCFSGSNFLGRNLGFLPSVFGNQPVL